MKTLVSLLLVALLSLSATVRDGASSYLNFIFQHGPITSKQEVRCVGAPSWTPIAASSSEGFSVRGKTVYLFNTPIKEADPASFSLYYSPEGHVLFEKDDNHVFSEVDILDGVDPCSFTPLDNDGRYAKDKFHAYWFNSHGWGEIHGANTSTFSADQTTIPYAKDSRYVYLGGNVLAHADPATFRPFPKSYFSKDQRHVFFSDGLSVSTVAGADPASFLPFPAIQSGGQLIDSLYGKDKDSIFCMSSRLSEANYSTFGPTSAAAAQDGTFIYDGCGIYDPGTP